MAREADRHGTEIGLRAYLQRVSDSGKAIQVSVVCEPGARGVLTWVPISMVHDESEIYGVDANGLRQAKGEVGRLIVKAWFTSRPEVRDELAGKGIPVKPYEGSEP